VIFLDRKGSVALPEDRGEEASAPDIEPHEIPF
jgi:hypothetical protein